MLLIQYRSLLVDGLITTLWMSFAVVFGSTFFSIILAVGLSQRVAAIRKPAFMIVEVLRDIPLIVLVFLVYFILPKLGCTLDPFWSTVLSVSIWGGANGAQVIRGGLQAVPLAQRDTAQAFGLHGWRGVCLVILPQAMPVILPPYIGLVTAWVQATSLGAVIGAHELFRSAQVIIEQTTLTSGGSPAYLVYGSTLLVYLLMCWTISRAGQRIEARFMKPYLIQSSTSQTVRPAFEAQAAPADGRT
jgi:polar amino acid transport system permease protein